jgi:hypothetical protein
MPGNNGIDFTGLQCGNQGIPIKANDFQFIIMASAMRFAIITSLTIGKIGTVAMATASLSSFSWLSYRGQSTFHATRRVLTQVRWCRSGASEKVRLTDKEEECAIFFMTIFLSFSKRGAFP